MTYTIRHETSGQTLARDLTAEQVDAWWKQNEARYFGVRIDGAVIIVADARA